MRLPVCAQVGESSGKTSRSPIGLREHRLTAALVLGVLVALLPPLPGAVGIGATENGARSTSVAEPQAKFEVASIKPCPPDAPSAGRGGGASGGVSPGAIFLGCMRAAELVHLAFVENGGLSGSDPMLAWGGQNGRDLSRGPGGAQKIRGGPSWAYSERFAIEAKAPDGTAREVMLGPMLRALLEERFMLKIRRDVESTQTWALTVGSQGSKLTPSKDGDCVDLAGTEPTAQEYLANKEQPICGRRFGDMTEGAFSWRFGRLPVSELVTTLSREMGTTVLDQTALPGTYTFTLRYAIDQNVVQGNRLGTSSPPSGYPTIFKAVEEQLGLNLSQVKAGRGFILIEHIERPRPDLAARPLR